MTFLSKSYDVGPFLLSDGGVLAARPPKALPGDRVSSEGVLLVRAVHKQLVGIVDFRNRTSMGRSRGGIPLYLFHPIDPGYPPFIVGSNNKPAENWFCTVEFVSWTDEWPRGAIQERLGPVGDAAVERRALVAAASIPEPKATAATAATAATVAAVPAPVVDLSSYKDEPWDSVFHIDPAGCEDVDDILAWRDEADGSTTWLIGIADVAAWIPEGSALDHQASLRAQTLYDNGVPVSPMLPPILSTGLASLRSDGVKRPVVGLRVVVSSGGAATVGGLDFYQVAVKETYTYESVQGTDVGKRVRGFASALSLSLGKDSDDSHEWIETVMVAYNVHVARTLRSAGLGLLRRLPASETPYAALSASTGCAELEHLGRQAGEYCAAASTVDVAHTALGLSEYCHASSPLRRYADLVNQRVLHHLLRGSAKPAAVSAAYLNHRASVLRRTERDLWFLSHLARSEGISETEGILLTDSSAYCPEWKRVLRVVVESESLPSTTVPGSLQGIRGLVRVFVDRARPRLHQRTVCAFVPAAAPVAPVAPVATEVADTI